MNTEQHATSETPGYHNRFGFPYKTTLSFVPYLKMIEEKAKDTSQADSVIMRHILKEVKKCPELFQPIEDLSIVTKYRRQVDLLMSTLLPSTVIDSLIAGVIVAFQPVMIYGSQNFKKLFRVQENGIWDVTGFDPEKLYRELITFAGMGILFKHYKLSMSQPDIFKSKEIDRFTKTTLFYLPEINNMFTDVKVKKTPKPLEEIDFSPLKENIFNTEFWLTNFPPDTFEFEGITIYKMTDITNRESIAQLEYALLQAGAIMTHERIDTIREKFRSYFRDAELQLGIAPIFSYKGGSINHCGMENWYCLIPREKAEMMFEHFPNSVYQRAMDSKEIFVEDDLMKLEKKTPVEEELIRSGLRSLLIVPIIVGGKLIGAFELGSPQLGAFNFVAMLKLREILPIITVAFQRANEEFDNRVQAAMKESFTAIHPSVEWKFVDSVMKVAQSGNKTGTISPIQFDDVVPLYGQVDVRGSSDKRNEAVRLDMKDYLRTATNILRESFNKYPLPILDELLFRANRHLEKIDVSLDSGEESGIMDFMHYEIQPALRIVEKHDAVLKKTIDHFIDSLSPNNEFYHMRRRDFEQSLTMINDTVATMLDAEEVRTQKLLPHYFEKYKTDGVEYNIYLGQSILHTQKFDQVYVKSFRLWQLISMVNVARETRRIQSALPVQLDTTHLILCYSNPFSVMFRMDEKRFDVAGAYNIRYEIVKKRIDKAHIKDTNERITQPGNIAIIYTQEKEEREYERYFDYMRSKGLIEEEVEHVELEALQGIQGLKAMRIKINYDTEEPKLQWNEEELFKQMKEEMV